MKHHDLSAADDDSSTTTESDIATLRMWIAEAKSGSVVFFGGAGVSTESGIPDFRSSDGLFKQKYPYPPEVMVSRSFFNEYPGQFFDFYCEKMIFADAKPNQAHRKLAGLERAGTLRAIITQNIDGLHQAAGSKKVVELHGSVWRNVCMGCKRTYTLEELLAARAEREDGIPRCPHCGSIIKPDVVLYEEPLDEASLVESLHAVQSADLLIIAGTSLVVYPAAGLVDAFQGSHLAIINRSTTPKDSMADLCITADVGSVFDF